MEVIDLPLELLRPAAWNPNRMGPVAFARLRESISRFGVVSNLVVRPLGDGSYEVLSGNHRLELLWESSQTAAPCVVVDLPDAPAKLLAQALNRIQGDDDLGLRAELVREVLKEFPQEQVLSLLPESAESLAALSSLGQEDLASYLRAWQRAEPARLKHLTVQLTPAQQVVVDQALTLFMALAHERGRDSPNIRGTALYLLCLDYLKNQRSES